MRYQLARRLFLTLSIAALGAGCGGSRKPEAPAPSSDLALSGLAAQRVIVLPSYAVRVAPELSWSVGRPRDVSRTLDAEIKAALDERGATKSWLFPADLDASFRRNSTYATDPYALAQESLRSPSLATGTRLVEPLASQLRTAVALHDDVRLMLAPVELRFEPAGQGLGRAAVRLVLIDARTSDVRWIGDAQSDPAPTFGPMLMASVAAHLADLIAK